MREGRSHRAAGGWPVVLVGICVTAPIGTLGIAATAWGGPVAGPTSVHAAPRLFPAFSPRIQDYVVHCNAKRPVKLIFSATGATRVSVNGHQARRGRFDSRVALVGGRALRFLVDSGPQAGTYHVRCLPRDFPHWRVQRLGQPQARWYAVGPVHLSTPEPSYAVLFDDRGVPVWWKREHRSGATNVSVLPDGNVAWYPYDGAPFGMRKDVGFVEHALDGRAVRRYKAVGGPTDLHELQVLPNGHAFVDIFKPRNHVDLSSRGKSKDATVVDGVIQELDRKGRVVWSWSTRDHIAMSESKHWSPVPNSPLPDGRVAYDMAHVNSVDPNGDKVVVSLRHTDAVYEIDKRSGDIVWKLGGTHTLQSLRFVDDPFGDASFGGQHDARLSDDGRFLTVYDNRVLRNTPPRAVRYAIDTGLGTATLLESVGDKHVQVSRCCGSARRLPGGNWVVSWGQTPLVTEATARGARVLVLRFGNRTSFRAVPVLPGVLTAAALRRGMDAMAP